MRQNKTFHLYKKYFKILYANCFICVEGIFYLPKMIFILSNKNMQIEKIVCVHQNYVFYEEIQINHNFDGHSLNTSLYLNAKKKSKKILV